MTTVLWLIAVLCVLVAIAAAMVRHGRAQLAGARAGLEAQARRARIAEGEAAGALAPWQARPAGQRAREVLSVPIDRSR
jgi:hypothetical protein